MADVNIFSALYKHKVEATIRDSALDNDVVLSLKSGEDTFTLFMSTSDLDVIYGTINNYLESKVNA
jgi:hypothetical protein